MSSSGSWMNTMSKFAVCSKCAGLVAKDLLEEHWAYHDEIADILDELREFERKVIEDRQ